MVWTAMMTDTDDEANCLAMSVINHQVWTGLSTLTLHYFLGELSSSTSTSFTDEVNPTAERQLPLLCPLIKPLSQTIQKLDPSATSAELSDHHQHISHLSVCPFYVHSSNQIFNHQDGKLPKVSLEAHNNLIFRPQLNTFQAHVLQYHLHINPIYVVTATLLYEAWIRTRDTHTTRHEHGDTSNLQNVGQRDTVIWFCVWCILQYISKPIMIEIS